MFQPQDFLRGLSLTVDYFNISVEDVIASMPPTVSLNQCLQTGSPDFCNRIQRDFNGSLWASNDAFIRAYNQNIGGLDTSGFDVDVGYNLPIGSMGSLAFRLTGTYLDELITTPVAGEFYVGEYDCAGLYGSTCGVPAAEWRHSARITWQMPWNVDVSLAWRYFGDVEIDLKDSNPLLNGAYASANEKLDAQNYLDIAASWTFLESYSVDRKNVTCRGIERRKIFR